MTASLDRVLAIARAQLGYAEGAGGRNKFGAAYGMDGVAWCAQFVWWCFREAGVPLGFKSAYTPTIADWYRARNQWGPAPRAGALVLFDFPGDGVNRISHIGIVEAVNRDGTVTTLEGNTSGTAGGSQRNGGVVARKIRKVGIVGYGYPSYPADPIVTPPAPPARPTEDEDLTPEQAQMLAVVYNQLTGSTKTPPDWKGWPSWPGGSGRALTPVDFQRQADVQLASLTRSVAELSGLVGALTREVKDLKDGRS